MNTERQTKQKLLGQRLRKARRASEILQLTAAHSLGIPRQCISKIEAGTRSVKAVELAILAELYGVSLSTLCAGLPEYTAKEPTP